VGFIDNLLIRFMQDNPTAQELGLPTVKGNAETAQNALNLLFGITGAIAVIIIIVISIIMVTGGNDPEKIARTKRALIYTFIGLALVLSAEAIVLVVLNNL